MSKFTVENLERMRHDIPDDIKRTQISDDVQLGLRAIVYRDDRPISLFMSYAIGEDRRFLKIGNIPDVSIEEARRITATVQALAAKGVDVRERFSEVLVDALKGEGVADAEARAVAARLVEHD